jgi:hypothetical protein
MSHSLCVTQGNCLQAPNQEEARGGEAGQTPTQVVTRSLGVWEQGAE